MPDAIEQRQHLFDEAQLEQGIVARDHLGLATALEQNLRARLGRLARTHMGQHPMAVQHALDQDLQLAAGGLLAEQTRRDHPGIVEHHQVARAQMLQQIGELTVSQGPARPIQGQQAAALALGQRVASDQGIRELKGKIGDAHDGVQIDRAAKFSGNRKNSP
ncbi:hypothetical protein D3C80_1220850 [compost metagenome]